MRCGILAGLLVLASTTGLAYGQVVPAGFAVQGLVLEPFASDPVGFTMLPDGRFLLLERQTGNVRLAPAGGGASVVILTVPAVEAAYPERGLLGVAVDPGWPARPYVYFYANHTDARIHITMYTASGDLTSPASLNLSLQNPYRLLDDIPDNAGNHNGGTLRFGPDGYLYASVGDDADFCSAPNLDVIKGKILRLDVSGMPGAGGGPPPKAALAPAGNPFSGSDNARLIFARGFRNPFRFCIDRVAGDLAIGDVGQDSWEEIDDLRYAGYSGENFGWPALEGFAPYSRAGECLDLPPPPYTAPIYVYPNPPGPEVAAVVGGPIYRTVAGSPVAFGSHYDGDVFFCEFYARWMRRLKRTGSSWTLAPAVQGQPDSTDWATGLGNVADLQVGADGALYYLNMITGSVPRGLYRIARTNPVEVENLAGLPALRCAPNPASVSGGTVFSYSLGGQQPMALSVFDIRGRLVRSLPLGSAGGAPRGAVHWDGRDETGSHAPPGVYVYKLESSSGPAATGKLTLVRDSGGVRRGTAGAEAVHFTSATITSGVR